MIDELIIERKPHAIYRIEYYDKSLYFLLVRRVLRYRHPSILRKTRLFIIGSSDFLDDAKMMATSLHLGSIHM